MTETPFFFPNESYKLFGVLHLPDGKNTGRGFVFCHPFAEEKLWTQRVYVSFARELAAAGHAVLRFDFMGQGDSEGSFEESTVDTNLSDIRCAIRTLREEVSGVSEVGLLGHRFGATLACLAAETDPDISWLVLWEPVVNGSSYMRELLRVNIVTQTAVYREVRDNTEALIKRMQSGETANIDGYEMSWELFEQASRIDLLAAGKSFMGKVLLLQLSRGASALSKNLDALRRLYANCDLSMAVEEPFWKEIRTVYGRAVNAFAVTEEWLQRV